MNKIMRKSPLIAAGMVPAATVTTALLSSPSFSASGDLDPTFGEVGRLGPILDGPAWSVQPQSDGTILLGGGSPGFEYWGWYGTTNFVTRLSNTGTADPAFVAARPANAQVLGIVRQPDGQVVAAGRRMNFSETRTQLLVYRLQPDGLLDTTFGNGGLFLLPEADYGSKTGSTSIVLDPDGRIVVAGSRDENLIVLRLLPDGSLDASFGVEGVFERPANLDHSGGRSGARTNLLRTSSGGYRVTATGPEGCQVVALTADGTVDTTFGDAGVATVVMAAGPATWCNSMDAQPNGSLLVAGSENDRGFVARLSANGQQDPTFIADAVAAALARATAVAADGDAAVVIAGVGDGGMSVMRLNASGGLDAAFGNAGTATFDLETDDPVSPVVNDLAVGADRRIIAAGGVCAPDEWCWADQAFVVRLLGNGGDSPGVLGISERFDVEAEEGDGEVVVNVRRTGGRSGSVSLTWDTVPVDWASASPGEDYGAVSGTLTWADGDAAEQQIRVPILADDTIEEHERFQVVLSGHQDGAGLGTRRTTVVIAPDGAPHGQFGIDAEAGTAEGHAAVVSVFREYYSSGVVSVTLTPMSGSATAGQDFVADPVTVTWADGELGWKDVSIPTIDDDREENLERFTIALSDPTGGALIGPWSTATVTIGASDRPAAATGSGGGAFGFLSLLALGLVRCLGRVGTRSRQCTWADPGTKSGRRRID